MPPGRRRGERSCRRSRPGHVEQWSAARNGGIAARSATNGLRHRRGAEPGGTTHLTVDERDGNVVAMTPNTLPRLRRRRRARLQTNNGMNRSTRSTGRESDRAGQGGVKRGTDVVLRDGRTVLASEPRLTRSKRVAQVIDNGRLRKDPTRGLRRPRIHCEGGPGPLEAARVPPPATSPPPDAPCARPSPTTQSKAASSWFVATDEGWVGARSRRGMAAVAALWCEYGR